MAHPPHQEDYRHHSVFPVPAHHQNPYCLFFGSYHALTIVCAPGLANLYALTNLLKFSELTMIMIKTVYPLLHYDDTLLHNTTIATTSQHFPLTPLHATPLKVNLFFFVMLKRHETFHVLYK